MIFFLTALITSLISTYLIIKFNRFHADFSADGDFSGPQKFHKIIVPRVGGIGIAVGLLSASIPLLNSSNNDLTYIIILLCCIPTFSIGLTEDLTKRISVRKRLFLTMISSFLMVNILQAQIVNLGIPGLNNILAIPFAGTIFTIFAITGLANSYNIIDGFHGLSSMIGMITLMAIGYIAFILNDSIIMNLCLVMIGAITGFFIWNYPRGLIFLGDGGAYLIGFWVGCTSVLITCRHSEISPWFALVINGYPIIETIFTIYRRLIYKHKSPGQPDGIHLHTLIFRRILSKNYSNKNWLSKNAKTAPYLWALSIISVAPAVIWWRSTISLMITFTLFSIFYIFLYTKIVHFKTPRWLNIDCF